MASKLELLLYVLSKAFNYFGIFIFVFVLLPSYGDDRNNNNNNEMIKNEKQKINCFTMNSWTLDIMKYIRVSECERMGIRNYTS